MLHLLVVGIAAIAVLSASRFPGTSNAAAAAPVPSFALSGARTALADSNTAFLRPGGSLETGESVAQIAAQQDITSVRATGGVAPTSSFSSGVAAAAAVSNEEGAGVRPLADVVDPLRPYAIYVTQPGDTVSSIAQSYGIETGTLLDNNLELGGDGLILVGQEIIVPRADGILHKVGFGESVSSIVDQYDNITSDEVIAYRPNGLADGSSLESGRFVLLPGATRKPPPPPPPPPSPTSDGGSSPAVDYGPPPPSGGRFAYPLANWSAVTDPFGTSRGAGRIHEGIDLGLWSFPSSQVFAACDGTVVRTEWLTYSYGYHVVIDCGDGWTTLYAHFSEIIAVQGQYVTAGTVIGISGSTGFSTGEHLHFEIRQFGTPYDPALYLDF